MSLRARDITVAFGGLVALSGVDLEVERGTIVGLVGPNGAGKTTLFNCMTGVVHPQRGTVHLDDTEISGLRLDRRIRLGISRTFQTPRFDPAATVLDAVLLGFYPRLKQGVAGAFLPSPRIWAKEAELRRKAVALIEDFELAEDPLALAGELSLGRLRLMEVARALASEPQFLLLDEPAAGIDDRDRDLLAAAIRKAAARNLGVLLVEHNVGFVAELCERMVALVQGQVVAEGPPASVVGNEQVIAAYLGTQRVAA